MNLILCGMMGAGKTSVGVRLAELTGRRWYDTDQMIADSHGRITDLFEYYGEEHFRRIETELVKTIADKDGLVISSGGGLVLRAENYELLKENGKIIFLRATPETLIKRLKIYEDKPFQQVNSRMLAQKLKELFAVRSPAYEAVADYVFDVDDMTTEQTANLIVEFLKERAKTGVGV